jgi:hypothetical protein
MLVVESPSRPLAPCGTLPPVSLLTELDAFYTEHRRCGELEAGVDGPVIWICYECGARAAHLTSTVEPPYRSGMDRRRFLVSSLAGAVAAPVAAGAKFLSPMLTITGTGR